MMDIKWKNYIKDSRVDQKRPILFTMIWNWTVPLLFQLVQDVDVFKHRNLSALRDISGQNFADLIISVYNRDASASKKLASWNLSQIENLKFSVRMQIYFLKIIKFSKNFFKPAFSETHYEMS